MVNISRETSLQAEIRLRRVIRQAALHVYPGLYAFKEYPIADFGKRAHAAALALVRDDRTFCALVPAETQDRDVFGICRFHFPPGIDNSGFVGWLATHLKAKFGTGVFVTCGSNSDAGGIYDYWGVPAALKEAVFNEIEALTGRLTARESELILDGVLMEVAETSPSSVIEPGTVFRFRQDGMLITGEYEGGRIRRGHLVGILWGQEVSFCFSQLEVPNSLQTGQSTCTLQRRDGSLELVEHFRWEDPNRVAGINVLRAVRYSTEVLAK